MATNRSKFIRDILGWGQRIKRTYSSRISAFDTELSKDIGNVSYSYWDRAYHGKAEGLEISGLLLKPLVSKVTAWVMGRPPKVRFESIRKTRRLARWQEDNHHKLTSAIRTSLKLGDGYFFINPDLSVTTLDPASVFPIVDEKDFSKIIGWKIIQLYQHPETTEEHIITEEFTHSNGRYYRKRTITDRAGTQVGETESYSLPISEIPLIHIPNNRSENERFGRPEGEMLVELLHRYGEILDAALDGNTKQGRPTPTFSGLGSQREVDAFWDRHGTLTTRELDDGTVEQYYVLDFDADRAITLGGSAKFTWESPGSASKDTEVLTGLLFYIYIQHIELPEWLMGNALTGSQSSAEVQVDPLVMFITLKRLEIEPWFKKMIKIVCEMIALAEPFMTLTEDELIQLVWPVLTRKDGQLVLQAAQWSYGQRIIDKSTVLDNMPFDVADPDKIIELAKKEDRPEENMGNTQATQKLNSDPSVQSGRIDNNDQSNNAQGNKNGPDRQLLDSLNAFFSQMQQNEVQIILTAQKKDQGDLIDEGEKEIVINSENGHHQVQ